MTPLEFCEKYSIENYTINSDNTIDADGQVFLYYKLDDMKKLPIKFGNVSGYFSCEGNNLTTLECCPTYVSGELDCSRNKLTSLEYCPKYVGGDFYCSRNKLTSLEYCPKYVGDNFYSDIITHHILGNVQGKIYYKNKQRIII
jgi:hypothetical protein